MTGILALIVYFLDNQILAKIHYDQSPEPGSEPMVSCRWTKGPQVSGNNLQRLATQKSTRTTTTTVTLIQTYYLFHCDISVKNSIEY